MAKNKQNKNKALSPGTLLLAEPFMQDLNFKRAVILVCEHNEEGSFGLILNKTLGIQLKEAVPEMTTIDAPLYLGGPVQMDTLHFLHKYGDLIQGSVKLADGLYWGGDFEQVKFLLDTGQVDSDGFRFFLGYSGWGSGQIQDELDTNSWIVTQKPLNFIFQEESDNLWSQIMRNMGGQFKILANFPESPSLN